MTALKTRVARLEAERRQSDRCQLCYLILLATQGETDAKAWSRHPPHTLEQLVLRSMAVKEDGDPRHGTGGHTPPAMGG